MTSEPHDPPSERPTATAATRAQAGGARADAALPARVGRFVVGEILGRGGMGVVARGRDETTGMEVALKFLDDAASSDDAELLRVEREGRMLSALRHPHAARLLGVEEVDRAGGGAALPVLVLELVEGETLAQALRSGALPQELALRIGAQVASAVAAAHERGIVHRDLKPANVKLSADGAKVLDFGLAAREEQGVARSLHSETSDLDASGQVAGTIGYMSPEQVAGAPPSRAADAWAFGCVLLESLTGRRAFDGADAGARVRATLAGSPDLSHVPATLPDSVREAMIACFARDPSARPAMQDLARLLAGSCGLDAASLHDGALSGEERRAGRLPRATTGFVGRRSELADLRTLVLARRLTTLTGAGGSGKTRLALETGLGLESARPESRFADGIVLVELGVLADATLLAEHVAAGLGLAERKDRPVRESLLEFAATKDALIILDNCEHVAGPVIALVSDLLAAGERVSVLATSREPLRIAGEHVLALPPLSVPLGGATSSSDLARLAENESVALFVDRARAARRGFRLDASTANAVARCCRRLDGIPLAIELAAARLRHVDVSALVAELDESFAVLTGGSPAALPRHQALRATIDWCVDRLDAREAALHRRLSMMAGSFSLPLAERVAPAGSLATEDVLASLLLLQEKSLVQAGEAAGGMRWRLLEPLKQHARERLEAAGESAGIRQAFVEALAEIMERASPRFDGPELQEAVTALAEDHANVVEAVRLAPEAGLASRMLRALGGIGSFFVARSAWREGIALVDGLLPAVQADDASALAPAFLTSAQLHLMLGNAAEAQRRAIEARRLFEQSGDQRLLAEALNTLSQVAWEQLRLDEARALGEASLQLRLRLGLRALATNSLNQLGLIARSARDFPAARRHLEEALAIQREIGNDFTRTAVLINLAVVVIEMKDHDGARPLLAEALELAVRTGSRRGEVFALLNLAQVELARDDAGAALALQRRAAPLIVESGDRSAAMSLVLGRARVAQAAGDAALTARCLGAATALRDHLGAARFHDQDSFDRGVARAGEALGDERLEAEMSAGRSLDFEAALDLVLS